MSINSQTDVEQLIDIIDRALTSKDERVINALRSLMMITLLTDPGDEESNKREVGPLRELVDSVNHLTRRLASVEVEISRVKQQSQMDSYNKWPSNTSASDYYYDKNRLSMDYGAIPPLTAQTIADLTKQFNSPLVDKKRKF